MCNVGKVEPENSGYHSGLEARILQTGSGEGHCEQTFHGCSASEFENFKIEFG
jgi:hypothetical protein